jgi:hypothetical protein
MSALVVSALRFRTCSEGPQTAIRVEMCMAQRWSLMGSTGWTAPTQWFLLGPKRIRGGLGAGVR